MSASTSSVLIRDSPKLVRDMTDDDVWNLRRGGLDYRKIYAAYKAATEMKGATDGDPRQDHQGLDARPRGSGQERNALRQEPAPAIS